MMRILLAAPSPSPTGPPTGVDSLPSPTFWLVVLGAIAFIVVVRAVNIWLGWGPRGDRR